MWKEAPPCARRGCPQPAAVRGDDRARDRQAQAEALRLGGVERLEQLRRRPAWKPGPRSMKLTCTPAVVGAACGPIDAGPSARARGHRLRGVHHQVEHHLLELDAVALDRPAGAAQARQRISTPRVIRSPCAMLSTSRTSSLASSGCNCVSPRLNSARSRWITSPARWSAEMMSSQDLAPASPGRRSLLARKCCAACALRQDRGERLVQLVGDAAGELAEHRHARKVRELHALLVRVEFGARAPRAPRRAAAAAPTPR